MKAPLFFWGFFLLWNIALPLKSSESLHLRIHISCIMVAPVFRASAEPTPQSSSFGHIHYHMNHRRADTPHKPTPSTYIPHPHSLEQKPFNHLSIWAYLAIAFILFAVTTVFAYLLYTCYHSGKSRERGNMATWPRVPRLGGNGNMSRAGDKVSDVGDGKQSESEVK